MNRVTKKIYHDISSGVYQRVTKSLRIRGEKETWVPVSFQVWTEIVTPIEIQINRDIRKAEK